MNVALRILILGAAPVMAIAGAGTIPACIPMPSLLHAEQPKYPARESRVAVEGAVELKFTVEPDGSVTDPIVVGNEPADTAEWFSASALEAMRRFKYAAVKSPCRGRTKIVFRIVTASGTPNKSFERTRGR